MMAAGRRVEAISDQIFGSHRLGQQWDQKVETMKIGWTTTTTGESKGSCNRCGKANANRLCPLCGITSYCSKECYKFDRKHGGHKETCQALQQDLEESSNQNIKLLVRDLFDMELEWFMSLSHNEIVAMTDGGVNTINGFRRNFGTYMRAGNIALVLARVNPCAHSAHYMTGTKPSEMYCDSVLVPFFQKHKKVIRSEGFALRHTQCLLILDDNNACCHYEGTLVKNKRSSLIKQVDSRFVRRGNYSLTPCSMDDFYHCNGTWKFHPMTCAAEDACMISYYFAEPASVFKAHGRYIDIDKSVCFDLPTHFEEAATVGRHFCKSLKAMKTIGINLCLGIKPAKRWSDDAIVKMWLAAANNDVNVLLDWLDRRDIPVIWTEDIPRSRLLRIKKVLAGCTPCNAGHTVVAGTISRCNFQL